MNMKRLLAGLLTALMLLTPALSLADAERRIEALESLCGTLEQNHYNLYALISEADWKARKEETKRLAQTLDDEAFAYALIELAASLHDAHTQAGLAPEAQESMRVLPLSAYWFDDGLRLIAVPEEQAQLVGCTLLAIDGTPVETVYERFSVLLSYDNEAYRRKQFAQSFMNADALSYLGLLRSADGATLTVRDENGIEADVRLDALSSAQIQSTRFAFAQRAATPAAEQARAIYQATELTEDALLISYYSCQEDPNLPMAAFAQQVKAQLEAGSYTRVLVDLRYNGGGDSSVIEPLLNVLDGLRQSRDIKLITLIGENTFSSALMNAVQLRQIGAQLVGRPTGGSVNHYGELGYAEVEGLPLVVYYSTKRFVMDASYGEGSLLPDTQVPFIYADYIEGRDADVEAALAL